MVRVRQTVRLAQEPFLMEVTPEFELELEFELVLDPLEQRDPCPEQIAPADRLTL
jgi:hypothetical protein